MSCWPKLNGTLSQFLTREKNLLSKNLGKFRSGSLHTWGLGLGASKNLRKIKNWRLGLGARKNLGKIEKWRSSNMGIGIGG